MDPTIYSFGEEMICTYSRYDGNKRQFRHDHVILRLFGLKELIKPFNEGLSEMYRGGPVFVSCFSSTLKVDEIKIPTLQYTRPARWLTDWDDVKYETEPDTPLKYFDLFLNDIIITASKRYRLILFDVEKCIELGVSITRKMEDHYKRNKEIRSERCTLKRELNKILKRDPTYIDPDKPDKTDKITAISTMLGILKEEAENMNTKEHEKDVNKYISYKKPAIPSVSDNEDEESDEDE